MEDTEEAFIPGANLSSLRSVTMQKVLQAWAVQTQDQWARAHSVVSKSVLACRERAAISKLGTAPHLQISVYHIQPWITPGGLCRAWEAAALHSLQVTLPKHWALPAV